MARNTKSSDESGDLSVASAKSSRRTLRAPKDAPTTEPKPTAPETAPVTTAQNAGEVPAVRDGSAPTAPKQQRADLDIEHFRDLLFTERVNLENERDSIRARSGDMSGTIPEDGEAGEEDTADLATAIMDKEFDLSVEDEIEEQLAQVDRALQKIDEGTYGICDMSGKEIPVARLELIPYATLTAENQAISEGEI